MYALVEDIEEHLVDAEERKRWLVLEDHPDFAGHWQVNGFNKDFIFDFIDFIGVYRVLAPSGLARFLDVSKEAGYKVAFFEDPTTIIDQYEHLNDPPEIVVQSPFEGTVNGMLPFQVQGFNMLKDREWGVARWDTGTGKTVLASALVKYQQRRESFDLCFFCVKKNNKVNTMRKLKRLVGVESIQISGSKRVREKRYGEIRDRLAAGERGIVVVLNYEKFKDDFVIFEKNSAKIEDLTEWGHAFFPERDVMCIWDEMPVKLKTRTTRLYKAIVKCLYMSNPPQVNHERLRVRSLRSYMLSATPIENSPEDWFNCVRVMDGGRTYGTVSKWHEIYVASWNFFDDTKPETYHEFERMRLAAAHFVHSVDKSDPDIAVVFPEKVEELVYIDWDEKLGKLYGDIQNVADELNDSDDEEGLPILSLINLFQMICDAPQMVVDSATRRGAFDTDLEAWIEAGEIGRPPTPEGSALALALAEKWSKRFTNDGHTKFDKLRELLLERHPNSKVALYCTWNSAITPYIEAFLQEWGINYVKYSGSERQKQAAQDAFQNDPDVRVFWSSDAGSDSIDLDAGNVVIDYNLPWKYTTVVQRHNRVDRVTSGHGTVYYYTLMMENSVEDRKLEIIMRKKAYHDALFDPQAGDVSASARMTKDDLLYILTGKR